MSSSRTPSRPPSFTSGVADRLYSERDRMPGGAGGVDTASQYTTMSSVFGQDTQFKGVALVTGAASGIGAAVAMAFAQEGCPCVAITDINAVKLEAMRLEILNNTGTDVTVLTAAGDISDERFVNALVKTIVEQTTRIDYLVNCAGVMGHSEITTNTLASQFDRINDINYRGSWLVTRAVLRVMIQQAPLSETTANNAHKPPQRGSIVNIAAQFGLVGRPRSTAYSASNAAIIAMTKGDAIDYSPWGIRINCVCPGFIDTPMVRGNPAANSALKPTIESKVPMRRIGLPEEVAWCVLFLCSNKASFVQGASLPVDGGFTAM